MRKTHRSIDFIIFEAFLQKKNNNNKKNKNKKRHVYNLQPCRETIKVLKKCYVEALLVKNLKTIMDE